MENEKQILNGFQAIIDFESVRWPDQNLFPLNIKSDSRNVQNIIYKDIENSSEYIIVTGFTSLSNLVDLFGSNDFSNLKK